MSINIFPNGGRVEAHQVTDTTSPAYARLVLTDSSSSTILIATAPMLGITIEERADCNVTKALDGNFLITSFGDSPVKINITGMNILKKICNNTDESTYTSMSAFFDKNKVSADVHKRIKLIIATSYSETKSYVCAIIGYDTVFREDDNEFGINTYSLHLIGVAVK